MALPHRPLTAQYVLFRIRAVHGRHRARQQSAHKVRAWRRYAIGCGANRQGGASGGVAFEDVTNSVQIESDGCNQPNFLFQILRIAVLLPLFFRNDRTFKYNSWIIHVHELI